MAIIRTDLHNLRPSARRLQFEYSTGIPRYDVQSAIEYLNSVSPNATLTPISAAGSVTVGNTDLGYEILSSVAGQVSFTLPSSANRAGVPIVIIDAGGVFFTYNGLVTLQSGETVRGSQTMILDGNYGYYTFRPKAAGSGYNLFAGA